MECVRIFMWHVATSSNVIEYWDKWWILLIIKSFYYKLHLVQFNYSAEVDLLENKILVFKFRNKFFLLRIIVKKYCVSFNLKLLGRKKKDLRTLMKWFKSNHFALHCTTTYRNGSYRPKWNNNNYSYAAELIHTLPYATVEHCHIHNSYVLRERTKKYFLRIYSQSVSCWPLTYIIAYPWYRLDISTEQIQCITNLSNMDKKNLVCLFLFFH